MPERIKELLNKIPYSLVTVGLLAWMYMDYFKFERGDDSPLAVQKKKLVAEQTEVNNLKKKIEDAKQFYLTLENKREELRAYVTKLAEMKATLSEDVNKPVIMDLITTEAKKAGLKVESIAPSPEKKQEYYIRQPFAFKFKGVYAQLLIFLNRLSDLKRILRVEEFKLIPDSRIRLGDQVTLLDGEITVYAFSYNSSQADEIINKQNTPAAAASGGKTP